MSEEILGYRIGGRPFRDVLRWAQRRMYASDRWAMPNVVRGFQEAAKQSPEKVAVLLPAFKTAGDYVTSALFTPRRFREHEIGVRAFKTMLGHVADGHMDAFVAGLLEPQYTSISPSPARLARLDEELERLFPEKRFRMADVACAADIGAPTTQRTGEKFESRLERLDAYDVFDGETVRAKHGGEFGRWGIRYRQHQIGGKPLPEKYDAVRIANALYYLTPYVRRRAIRNALASLSEGGGAILTDKAAYVVRTTGGKREIYCKKFAKAKKPGPRPHQE